MTQEHSGNSGSGCNKIPVAAIALARRLVKPSASLYPKIHGMVKSVTMDMSNSMYKIVRKCFPNAEQIVDRFHVQKLMYDALQDYV